MLSTPARPRPIARVGPAEPAFDIASAPYRAMLVGVFALAVVMQAGLFLRGLYTISYDESERTLLAYKLTLAKAVEPTIWPPFPRIANGLALKLHGDLFVTPRVLVGLAGLLTVAAVVVLARRLFDNRLIALLAGTFAVFIPQRLILSVVPMADIFAYVFVLFAACTLVSWLRQNRPSALLCTSCLLLLAATVRLESWFFNVALALYLAYRALARRDLRLRVFVLNAAVLAAFPCLWIAATYVHDGSLAALSLTSKQFLASNGHNVALDVRGDVLTELIRDAILSPVVLLGIISLVALARRDRRIRTLALLLFVPLAVLGASMLATFSVPMAAPFRTDGIWVMLLLPFAAWAVVRAAQRIARAPISRACAVVLIAGAFVVPAALRAQPIVRDGRAQGGALANNLLQRRIHGVLASSRQRILLDAIGNLDYLNVLVRSEAPDRFVLNVDADPTAVAIYATERRYYLRRGDTDVVRRYLTDKFQTANDLDVRSLRARGVGYVLAWNRRYIRELDADREVERQGQFKRWALFKIIAGTATSGRAQSGRELLHTSSPRS